MKRVPLLSKIFFVVTFLTSFANSGNAKEYKSSYATHEVSDTIQTEEVVLDSMTFYLLGDDNQIQNTRKGSFIIKIDDKYYEIPYRLPTKAVVDLRGHSYNFKMTGLSLRENTQLETYLKNLFRNPRPKLKEYISPKNWKNSPIYIQYFEPYDQNSTNTVEKRRLNPKNESEENAFLGDDTDGGIEDYENFPLPETIDLEVDLRKTPKILKVLGLEFNFDKLDKGFQELLLDYGRGSQKNRRSVPRND